MDSNSKRNVKVMPAYGDHSGKRKGVEVSNSETLHYKTSSQEATSQVQRSDGKKRRTLDRERS